MKKTHKTQMKILKELLFKPNATFTDLNTSDLTSDHFSYHIKLLLEHNYIIKNDAGTYTLTDKGKEFANTMDTEKIKIEKQPKVAVFIIPEKKIDEIPHVLIQKRLKEPYFGHQGFMSGKVQFGEPIHEAAKRELKEETGLSGNLVFKGIFHDIIYSKQDKLLEDKLFHIFIAQDCKGRLLKKFEGGENYWIKKKDFATLENKYYNEDEIFEFAFKFTNNPEEFYMEKTYHISEF